ncbi:MAG: hypothetical protein R3C10_09275 [Pirellulales bacterium]
MTATRTPWHHLITRTASYRRLQLLRAVSLLTVGLATVLAAPLPTVRAGDAIRLQSKLKPGDCTRIEALLEVGGDLTVVDGEKSETVPMSVVGTLRYHERLLTGEPADPNSLRSVRYYEKADAVIKIDDGGLKSQLAPDRRTVVADTTTGAVKLYSPEAALTRDQLDLIAVPGNSLLVSSLLPSGAVEVGDIWTVTSDAMAGVLGLDAVSATDVQCVLTDADADAAKVEISGFVHGAADGVATEIEIKARYKFDRHAGRVTWLAAAAQRETRRGTRHRRHGRRRPSANETQPRFAAGRTFRRPARTTRILRR